MAPSKYHHHALFLIHALVCIMTFFRRHARVFSAALPHFELHQDSSQPPRRPRAQEEFTTLSYLHSMLRCLLSKLFHRYQPGSPAPSPLTMDTATRHRVNRNKPVCAWYPASHVKDRPGAYKNKPVGQAPIFARLPTITSQHQQRHLPSARCSTTISRHHCGTVLQAGSCHVTPLQSDLGCPSRRHRHCPPALALQKPTQAHRSHLQPSLHGDGRRAAVHPAPARHCQLGVVSIQPAADEAQNMLLFVDTLTSAKELYDQIKVSHQATFISAVVAFKQLSSDITSFVTFEEYHHSNRFNVAAVTGFAKTAAAKFGRIFHFELLNDSDFAAHSRLVFTIDYNTVVDANDAVLITNHVRGLASPDNTAERIRFQTGVEPQSHRLSERGVAWLPCFIRHHMEERNLHSKRLPRRGKLLVQKRHPGQEEQPRHQLAGGALTSFIKTAEARECPLKTRTRGRRSNLDKNSREGQ